MTPTPPLARQPLLWWALVLALALLSFYVHILNGHVQRGAQWRESFAAQTPKRVAANEPQRRQRSQPPTLTRTAQR